MPSTPTWPDGFPIVQTINQLELPVNAAAANVVNPAIVSTILWAASPAGLSGGTGNALVANMPDATIAARQACAAAAVPLP
jgi:hypothetical protein